ncbi:unnamed protein product [Urochloa humidicola]
MTQEYLLIDKDETPVEYDAVRTRRLETSCGTTVSLYLDPSVESTYLKDGRIRFLCTIRVLREGNSSVPAPPSDIAKHLGTLLDTADGTDVSFVVDGETFHAHRAILVARSPVFRAELLGSMAEARMSSITLHDITAATFKAMLRFMYTDSLPGDGELGGSPLEMCQHLLAAADRYALDWLKLLCVQKLLDIVSLDTVCDALVCAEIYNCPELKDKCIGFVVEERNFRKIVLTDSFMQLGQRFPPILEEVRKRVAGM